MLFEKDVSDKYRLQVRESDDQSSVDIFEVLNSTIRNQKPLRVQILNPELEDKPSYNVAITLIH